MKKHTPGPWNIRKFDDGLGAHIDGSFRERNVFQIGIRAPNSDMWIPELRNTSLEVCRVYENEADAHLIAAAPEMLEALEVVKECLSSIDDECLSRSDRREIEKAEAYIDDALAKSKVKS